MTYMTKLLTASSMALAMTVGSAAAYALPGNSDMDVSEKLMTENPAVGGAEMLASQTIVENASAAPNLTTLVAAVTQAQLVETLSGVGPFTVFAPTNEAFGKLPAETTTSLMQDENRADLQKILTAHVLPGKYTAAKLTEKIAKNDGTYEATTVSGDTLAFYIEDGAVKVRDESGSVATVTTADVIQSNGVVHVVDTVLVPQ